ncbi:MAG: hypothetical protein QOH27_6462, partial [Mycobacterium sp.]|nr:hypothetical protein [Mycobacterium sp.]
ATASAAGGIHLSFTADVVTILMYSP